MKKINSTFVNKGKGLIVSNLKSGGNGHKKGNHWSPFGMIEKMTSLPPVFFTILTKCQNGYFAFPGFSGPLLNQQIDFPGVNKYARYGYINATC